MGLPHIFFFKPELHLDKPFKNNYLILSRMHIDKKKD